MKLFNNKKTMKESNSLLKKFIPINTNDLYLKLKEQNLKGIIKKDEEMIIWELDNNIIIKIIVNNQPHEGYIDILF